MAAAPDSEPVTDVLDKVHQKNEMRSGGSLSLDEVHRQLSENLKKSGKDDLRILVTGRTGAGKSALVNSIVGEYVAMEGDSPFRQTTEVTKYEKVVGDIAIAIYDSPGLQLQDGVEDEKEYLKDLEQNCKEVDLNLYCIRMDDRLQYKEKEAMKKLSKAFGMDEFWKNTLIVLTFANKINPQKTASLTPVDVFSKRMSEWKFLLRRVLIDKAGVSEKVAEEVPVVPVGCSDKPSLPAARCDYWLSDLWRQSLKRAKGIAKPILLNFNREQLRPSGEKMDEQPINPPGEKAPSRCAQDEQCSSKVMLPLNYLSEVHINFEHLCKMACKEAAAGSAESKFCFSSHLSLEDIRARQEEFAAERNWEQYHTPRNLLLAMVGEVGELSELFQWRGELKEGLPGWREEDRVHLGEELSDVLIYLVRLAERCHVDLPAAAIRKFQLNHEKYPAIPGHDREKNGSECKDTSGTAGETTIIKISCDRRDMDAAIGHRDRFSFSSNLSLEEIRTKQEKFSAERNWGKDNTPRNLLLALVTEVGELAEIFQWRGEVKVGLPGWTEKDKVHTGEKLGDVLIVLVRLSDRCHVDLPPAVTRKFQLNAEKYPANKVYGSSLKYTAYYGN